MNQFKFMNKTYRAFFLLLFCVLMFAAINGCGNGGGDTAATGTATSLTITVVPTPSSVYSGQQSIVVATVLNADATPAAGQTVDFSFAGGAATGASGATISAINSGLTNASGESWAVYTGGALTDNLDIFDFVQADVSGTVALATITRSKTDYAAGGYSVTSFVGDPATSPTVRFDSYGVDNCKLMLTVANNDILAPGVAGVPVTFSIFRGPGLFLPEVGPAVDEVTVYTDTNGEAYIFFDVPVPVAGEETIVRATVPLAPQTNGGDTVSVIYW